MTGVNKDNDVTTSLKKRHVYISDKTKYTMVVLMTITDTDNKNKRNNRIDMHA